MADRVYGLIDRLRKSGELVCYLDFRSGSLYDWSGRGNSGTFTGSARFTGDGGNLGIYCPSTGSYINVVASSDFNLTTGTIIGFVQTDQGASDINYSFFGIGVDTNDAVDMSSFAPNVFRAFSKDGGVQEISFGLGAMNTIFQHVIALTWSTTESAGFVNGLRTNQVAGDKSSSFPSNPTLRFGAGYVSSTFRPHTQYAGLLVNRVLSDTEVARITAELRRIRW